jgi:hypothetical protein
MKVTQQAAKKALQRVSINVYAGKRLTQSCQHDS